MLDNGFIEKDAIMHDDCKQEEKIQRLCEFKGATESDIKTLFNLVSDIKNNDLRHINRKLDGLLFSVLGSIIIAVISWGIKLLGSR